MRWIQSNGFLKWLNLKQDFRLKQSLQLSNKQQQVVMLIWINY